MKKVVLFLLFSLLLLFNSCTKPEAEIVGKWVPTKNEEIYFYWELTADKQFNYYEIAESCTFENGTLYVPDGCTWQLIAHSEYVVEGNRITFSTSNYVEITRVNKDEYIFKAGLPVDGVVKRVKKFATK